MSMTERRYDVYRQDARSKITFDTASPVATLKALVVKASAEYAEAQGETDRLRKALVAAQAREVEAAEFLTRWEKALDATRKTLGPEEDVDA